MTMIYRKIINNKYMQELYIHLSSLGVCVFENDTKINPTKHKAVFFFHESLNDSHKIVSYGA
jgi:hypothetical protein